jgi:hypothetical protein
MSPLERDALDRALASLPAIAPAERRADAARRRCRAVLEQQGAGLSPLLRARELLLAFRLLACRGQRALEAIVQRARGVAVRDEQPLPRRL